MKRLFFTAIATLSTIGCAATPSKAPVTVVSTRPLEAKKNQANEPSEKSRDATEDDAADRARASETKPANISDPHEARRLALKEAESFDLANDGSGQDLTALLSAAAAAPGVATLGSGGVIGGVGTAVPSVSGLRLASRRGPPPSEVHAKSLPAPTPPKPPGPPTRMTLVSLKVSGISSDSASDAFDRSDRALRDCYEAELERNPIAEATLTFEIGVGKDGRSVAPRTIESEPSDPSLVQCAQKAALEMTFARPLSEASVAAKLTMRRPPAAHLE